MSNIYNKLAPIVFGLIVFLVIYGYPLYKGSIWHNQEGNKKDTTSVEKTLDVIGNADVEIVRLVNSGGSDGQATNHKLIVQNGNNVLESYQFYDNDLQDFEQVEVIEFGRERVLAVKGLNVGAHSSSTRFFMVDRDITKLEPICSDAHYTNKCIFSSDRMSEPLIEDLNGDNVPEVVELNVGEVDKVNVRIYQFISNKVTDLITDGPSFALQLITPPSKEYAQIKTEYPSLN